MRRSLSLSVLFSSVALALGLSLVSGCNTADSKTADKPAASAAKPALPPISLLNVSYDPTREFYQEFNQSFAEYWKGKANQVVTIEQSHGGSGKQARAVIDGLEADVVTLALAYDVSAISDKAKLLPADWQKKLPHNSAPYTSTIVFLVRKGNPKQIKDWSDLTKDGVEVIAPNPKTSGGARWIYLAAWGYSLHKELGDLAAIKDASKKAEVEAAQAKAQAFITSLYKHVPVLDSGARGATNTFTQRGLGDVLVGWENEAFLAIKELGKDDYEIVVPSVSILAEPPVSVVDSVAKKHGTTEVAQAYLEHLYSPQGQQLAAKHFFRPAISESISESQRAKFAKVELFTVDQLFAEGWNTAQPTHFNDGGVFDQIYQPGSK